MDKPEIGRRVRIKYSPLWDGIFTIVSILDEEMLMIEIDHPVRGPGGFYPDHYELLPQTKLDRILR